MGPPIYIGGNVDCLDEETFSYELQWGHRFTSVETSIRLKGVDKITKLQWGHRFTSVETVNPH